MRVTSHVVSLVLGAALLYLAGQLARRRRLAWVLAIVLFAASAIVNVLRVHHDLAAAYSLVMVLLLLVSRKPVQGTRGPADLLRARPLRALVPIGVFTYGFAALYLERDSISPGPNFVGSVETILFGV